MRRFIIPRKPFDDLNIASKKSCDCRKKVTDENVTYDSIPLASCLLNEDAVDELTAKGVKMEEVVELPLNTALDDTSDIYTMQQGKELLYWQQRVSERWTGKDVNVGSIDTGLNYGAYPTNQCSSFRTPTITTHKGGWNFVLNNDEIWGGADTGTFVECGNVNRGNAFHGTSMAGVILDTNRHTGGAPTGIRKGMARDCNLYALKVIDTPGWTVADLLAAIQWCIDNNMHLMGCAWQLTSESVREAMKTFSDAGGVCVCGAGNSSSPTTVVAPARYDDNIAVTTIRPNGTKQYQYINPTGEDEHGVDFCVYAGGGVSGTWDPNTLSNYSVGPTAASSTSIATYIAIGVIACYMEMLGDDSPRRVVNFIKQNRVKKFQDAVNYGAGAVYF